MIYDVLMEWFSGGELYRILWGLSAEPAARWHYVVFSPSCRDRTLSPMAVLSESRNPAATSTSKKTVASREYGPFLGILAMSCFRDTPTVTCLVSGLDLACCVSVCLDFAGWAMVSAVRRGRLQERFALVSRVTPSGVTEPPSPTLKS